jgi:hypothetical protein
MLESQVLAGREELQQEREKCRELEAVMADRASE